MKIITENAVYVQKNDIAYLNSSDLPIPASIHMKVVESGIIDDSNRYEFVKFEEKSEIEYFKGLDWMIDYNKIKGLSETEIVKLAESIAKEQETIVTKFNSLSEEERKNNSEMYTQFNLLEFKFYSLNDVLCFMQGRIPMKLPKEVDLPTNGSVQKKVLES